MSPVTYVLICLGVTLLAWVIDQADDWRRRAALRRLAEAGGMHFAPGDRFNLAGRIASVFPVVGAAAPRVGDVLYGRRDDRYYYVFRFDYTVGGAARPQRRRAVVGFSEPRQRCEAEPGSTHDAASLQVADMTLPLIEQYRTMIRRTMPAPDPAAGRSMAEITLIADTRPDAITAQEKGPRP